MVREWEERGQDPTEVSKNRNSKKHKKRNLNYELSDPLMEFMASKSVFYYPALLPTCGLAQDCSRSVGQLASLEIIYPVKREDIKTSLLRRLRWNFTNRQNPPPQQNSFNF